MNKPSALRWPKGRANMSSTKESERNNESEKQDLGPATLDAYFARQREKPVRYSGQQRPEFQASLAAYHESVEAEDCEFYHTMEFPDGSVQPGNWDLRGHESSYIGDIDLTAKSVMEYGPASGGVSAFIAARAARLTVFDLPFAGSPEIVPYADIDTAQTARDAATSFARLRNSWWYGKRRLGYEAVAVYGEIYDLPPDLRRCDVSIFAAIMLHLSRPFHALEQAARHTDEAIVVTDVYSAPSLPALASLHEQLPTLAIFNPTEPPVGLTHWWGLSPDLVQHMLRLLGFTEQTVTTHSPARMDPPPPLFTVVGRRPSKLRVTGLAGKPAAAATAAGGAVPVPPAMLRFLVAGTEDEQTFLRLGALGFEALTGSIRRRGTDPATIGAVLDFGCGVGRVARHWAGVHGVQLHGTDPSTEMIAWNREHLEFGKFAINGPTPGLPYEDGQFGLVYAISVFTHFPVSLQVPWMQELVRITRPGGLIYITTHGVHHQDLLSPEDAAAFDRGEVVVTGDEAPGSNHCAAFHPDEWMQLHFVEAFDLQLLEHAPRGAMGNPEQDSWLMRRKV